jgi:hypothetical protein
MWNSIGDAMEFRRDPAVKEEEFDLRSNKRKTDDVSI